MKKIVIIGANMFQNKLIVHAKQLGFETHVFAWECGDPGEKSADFFYPISIKEKELILEQCKKINPVAICSIGSDLAVLTVNYIARKLGLNGNSELCDHLATNKFEMREAFECFGIYTPKHIKVTSSDQGKFDVNMKYPVIVKPTDRSGSRAITCVYDENEMESAVQRAIEQSFEKAAIIEEFIEGKEYSCECISFKGKHQILALTEKFTTGSPNYIEVGHIQPAPIYDEKIRKVIESTIFKGLDALDIKNSASHTEFKLSDDGEVRIIEIGARMGGDCIGSDLVPLSTGLDYMRMVIDVAEDKKPNWTKQISYPFAAIRFYMKMDDRKIKKNHESGIVEEYIADSQWNIQVRDSGSRLGYIITVHDNYSAASEYMGSI